ncbi:class II aldolase/adducin family protein [Haladaptatus salinisoli]|uniref:class II aldolase/adducin family protein n=1 Tax=Haladaptatus salinisoli TaxID=2884876 RepID=UPI001D0BB93C|nr:class II aldolase/adducin family protein [Haladaptatus salinisoli]
MTDSTSLGDERAKVGELGREMLAQELTKGTGGNVSVRSDDRFAISPSGVPYEDVTAESVPVVDLDGERLEGDLKPSNETPMHAVIYRERDDVGAIIHTHSPYASTFASLNEPIPASHYLIAYAGTEIPVAGYEPPGTTALGDLAMNTMGDNHDAVLLKNHGVITVGKTGADALDVALMVEYCARIHYQAINVGEPAILPDEAVEDLRKMFKTDYGQQ